MLKVLLGLVIAAEFFTVPMFLRYYWPKKCKQSLMFKMISATLFVVCGLLAVKISGNNTPYATMMIWGLVLGWVGDLLLHSLSNNQIHFAVGFLAFFAGHVFYIIAFQQAVEINYPAAKAFEWFEILFVLALVGFFTAIFFIRKTFEEQPIFKVAFPFYGLILGTMLVKALRYVIGEIAYGTNDHMVATTVTVGLGAILFTVSDILLGFILPKKNPKRIGRIINIVTYFAAQILLGCSILVVFSRYN